MGLLGLIILGFLKFQDNVSKSQVTSEAKMSELELKRQITTLFLDKSACYQTFVATSIGADVLQIKNSAGSAVFETNKTYESNSIKITKMKTFDKNVVNADGTRMIDFVISLERVKKQAYGQVKEIRIPLSVKAAGGSSPIQECFSNTDAVIQSALEEMCLSQDGIWNTTTKKCSYETFKVRTASQEKLHVTSSGNVGINTIAPTAKLDVNGEVRIGNTNTLCNVTTEGAIRYSSIDKKMSLCNGQNWVNIKPNTGKVDCMGSWSTCSQPCGGGQSVYHITQPSQNGGASCPAVEGQSVACNTNACEFFTYYQEPVKCASGGGAGGTMMSLPNSVCKNQTGQTWYSDRSCGALYCDWTITCSNNAILKVDYFDCQND